MIEKIEPAYEVKIYASGPIGEAEQIIRQYVLENPLCVTIAPTKHIYTGGEEEGYVVGLINYPRFPQPPEWTWGIGYALAQKLLEGTHQHSILIMDSKKTLWISQRDENPQEYKGFKISKEVTHE